MKSDFLSKVITYKEHPEFKKSPTFAWIAKSIEEAMSDDDATAEEISELERQVSICFSTLSQLGEAVKRIKNLDKQIRELNKQAKEKEEESRVLAIQNLNIQLRENTRGIFTAFSQEEGNPLFYKSLKEDKKQERELFSDCQINCTQ